MRIGLKGADLEFAPLPLAEVVLQTLYEDAQRVLRAAAGCVAEKRLQPVSRNQADKLLCLQ